MMQGMRVRAVLAAVVMMVVGGIGASARGAEDVGIAWDEETLSNGLRVIYAPMATSPVTHVRVLYHVGSRDERADRQGFAHMFEHMMFRGSAHVPPEEHMKLVNGVGGYSNAFTSFDKTEYVDTVPGSYTELALWLEADRMSSFKVSAPIMQVERLVVAGEWRNGQNRPYGTMWEDVFGEVFKQAPYRWTPIGNMDQLQAAKPGELQAFFNRYYVPNNAILVVAGGFDEGKVKEEVHRYFGWIKGTTPLMSAGLVRMTGIERDIPKEPEQKEARRAEVKMKVQLPREVLMYRMPGFTDPDFDAAEMLMQVLGDGRSSRLSRALVTNDAPLCVDADGSAEELEDGGIMGATATLLAGKDPAAVEKILREQIKKLQDEPVTAEELEKAKQQQRLSLATRFETAEKVTSELGETELMYGSLDRVKTARARLEALTVGDLQRVAKRFLNEGQSNYLVIVPGVADKAATAPAGGGAMGEPTTAPVAEAKAVEFPKDYPTAAPMVGKIPDATFAKGVESEINGVKVIVMEDHREPIVDFTLTTRAGSYAEPVGKDGLGGLTAAMVRRGPKGKTFDEFNEALESKGISLEVSDGGDNTEISGNCLTELFPTALSAMRDMVMHPAFDEQEFGRLKAQAIDGLSNALATSGDTISGRTLSHALYGDSVLGRMSTPATLGGITLEDVKGFYKQVYSTKGALLVIAGDISVADGQKAAATLLEGMATGELPKVTYELPGVATKRKILLVDNPDARESTIRMGIKAYDIHTDEKFAGSLTNQMLSSGIESRLGRYVRAEKGYVYGVQAVFQPSRVAGAFVGSTETKFETTGPCIEAMLTVFDKMKAEGVGEKELNDAKLRVAGGMLMSLQTIAEQAGTRTTGVLNGYPADYYDKYAKRIGEVTLQQIKDVTNKFIVDEGLTIVVVAPVEKVKSQLEKLGEVTVLPMPLKDQKN